LSLHAELAATEEQLSKAEVALRPLEQGHDGFEKLQAERATLMEQIPPLLTELNQLEAKHKALENAVEDEIKTGGGGKRPRGCAKVCIAARAEVARNSRQITSGRGKLHQMEHRRSEIDREIARRTMLDQQAITLAPVLKNDIRMMRTQVERLTTEIEQLNLPQERAINSVAAIQLTDSAATSLASFETHGALEDFWKSQFSCAATVKLLRAANALSTDTPFNCDVRAFYAQVNMLADLDAGIGRFRDACGDRSSFNARDVVTLVFFAQNCLMQLGITSTEMAELRTEPKSGGILYAPDTPPFELMVHALSRGAIPEAWIALLMAIVLSLLLTVFELELQRSRSTV
jgi:hypothetical protein